jgi:hypothetical protein
MALLAATRKSGELRVVGGRIDGRVLLDAGRVVGADVGRADSFVDAVFELLRLTTGKFSFDAEKQADDPGDPVDIEPLLLEASARLNEWRGIEAVVPSLDHGVVLVAALGDPHVTLAADQWRMVVAVAASRCAHDVAERLGLGEFSVCKALRDLVESGVVEVTDPPAPAASEPAGKKAEPAPASAKAAPASKAEPAPAAKTEPETEPESETGPDPVPEAKASAGKVAIEPERRPETATGKVAIPALTTKDDLSAPEPPAAEAPKPAPAASAKKAETAKAPAAKPESRPEAKVDPAQAKQLVSQLAALSSEPPEKAGKPAAKAETPAEKDDKADAEAADEAGAPTASTSEGGEGDEPLNRGLLLKFLSSVRQ